jgi:hypothetical protein
VTKTYCDMCGLETKKITMYTTGFYNSGFYSEVCYKCNSLIHDLLSGRWRNDITPFYKLSGELGQ